MNEMKTMDSVDDPAAVGRSVSGGRQDPPSRRLDAHSPARTGRRRRARRGRADRRIQTDHRLRQRSRLPPLHEGSPSPSSFLCALRSPTGFAN